MFRPGRTEGDPSELGNLLVAGGVCVLNYLGMAVKQRYSRVKGTGVVQELACAMHKLCKW